MEIISTMANERKTEEIVRSHFKRFLDVIHIAEQQSENAQIAKLLKTASKKGTGRGYPEFIITFKSNPNLIVVVECKANLQKHESLTKDQFSDYAVDGALLYASYLAKEFDVLAIAISGQEASKIRVSHFLHLKKEHKAFPVFSDELLSPEDYLKGYLHSPEKFRQDYDILLAFTKKLNEKLHTYKIPESQRSLLLSCILIALEDNAFKVSYAYQTTPKHLAELLVKTVSNQLKDAQLGSNKLENLETQFSFIAVDTTLTNKENALKELIDSIENNINSFIKSHEYFDVLGQLYIEFLRYANSDKGLGIVLTPPHITDFFAEVAEVNKNSIVYDNCTGTGGFLISAMKMMIQDAKGDSEKIKQIKQHQLIGTEYQAHIYALAVSNMYIHQDGKTNILHGSCFDNSVIAEIKKRKPTVGLLNPPYKGDKKTDTEELDFVLNNLNCLVDGGICVAILPMQCALDQKGKTYEVKKAILEKHTLEAVFSMPDELFFNSKVNVVTCVMVFKAHRKHPEHKEVFLGYFKEDGFDKRKNLGRIDVAGAWKERIKDQWIRAYQNRKEINGFSVLTPLKPEDEWCAEAYIKTDYSSLYTKHLDKTVRDFITFNLLNSPQKSLDYWGDIIKKFSTNLLSLKSACLVSKSGELLELQDLFDINYGINLELYKFDECDYANPLAIPFVSRTEKNNGVSAFVERQLDIEPNPAHTLSVAVGGSVLSTFYQPNPYYSGFHIFVLKPKSAMTPIEMLYYATMIRSNKYRYNYGRQANKTLKHLLLPATMPDELKALNLTLPLDI
jgi:type I restriction enzyme M protein